MSSTPSSAASGASLTTAAATLEGDRSDAGEGDRGSALEVDRPEALEGDRVSPTETLEDERSSASESEATTALLTGAHEASADAPDAPEAPADSAISGERMDRKRLEEQLLALKRKELELRRALAIADHPELAEAIRRLDGRAYALARVDAKIAQGLSKAEDRRKEGLEKKLSGLRDKRAELDRQIAELEAEHARLVHEREQALDSERLAALQDLVLTLGEHSAALAAAGLDVAELVPEIGQRMPEIRALAEQLASPAQA